MKKPKKVSKPKSSIIDLSTAAYDKAIEDPFAFFGNIRGTDKDDFDIDNLNKSAHLLGGSSFEEEEVNIAKTIREVVDSNMRVPRDVRIDDSGIPVATNLLEWVTKDRFSMINGEKPFIEQLAWGVIAFNEYCPVCSDVEYLYLDRAVDDTYAKFERKVCMLENGVCPNCKVGRATFIKEKKMNLIQELAVCAGQRCIVYGSIVLTARGMERIGSHQAGRSEGFSPFEYNVHNGEEFEKTSNYYIARDEETFDVTLRNGMSVIGTADHPLLTQRGFVKIKELEENTHVCVKLNQNCFGTVQLSKLNYGPFGVASDLLQGTKPAILAMLSEIFNEATRLSDNEVQIQGSDELLSDLMVVLANLGVAAYRPEGSSNLKVSGMYLNRLNDELQTRHEFTKNFKCYSDEKDDLWHNDCPVFLVQLFLYLCKTYEFPITMESYTKAYVHRKALELQKYPTVKDCAYVEKLVSMTHPDTLFIKIRGVTPAGKRDVFDFTLPETHRFIANGIVNHNSGKSMVTGGYLAPYLTHRLLKLQNPNAFYNLKTGTMLHCTFVALTYAQAKDTLWQNFYATLTESQWFKEYHSMLRHYENKYGEKLLKFNDTYVAYPARGLMAYPAGPDKRVLRGRTRYFASVDEVGWFDSAKDSKKVKDNAHEVVGALDRSLLTVRGAAESLIRHGYDDVYTGYAMNVSSPATRNDMICTLVRRAADSTTSYGVIKATWEVNPSLPRDSAAIESAYRADPITAERDYGAIPPLAASPLISSIDAIKKCVGKRPQPLKIKRVTKHSKKRGESFTWATLAKSKGCKKGTILALDAGFTNNSFAAAIMHNDDNGDAVVRALFEVIPEPGAPLNHAKIFEELLVPAMDRYNVRVLLADRWNSIKLLQDAQIQRPELDVSEQHSLKYKEVYAMKTRIHQGSILLPAIERKSIDDCLEFDDEFYPMCFSNQPASHLIMQLATVKDTSKSVDKGDGYTDDIFRAVALGAYALGVEEYAMYLENAVEEESNERPTAFGVSSHNSGGGTTWGTGTGGSDAGALGVYMPGRR